jgi:hypothetical protein
MATGKRFRFKECQCRGVTGTLVEIPAGVWHVAELDTVSVYLDGRVLSLEKSAFQVLKLERKAVLLD